MLLFPVLVLQNMKSSDYAKAQIIWICTSKWNGFIMNMCENSLLSRMQCLNTLCKWCFRKASDSGLPARFILVKYLCSGLCKISRRVAPTTTFCTSFSLVLHSVKWNSQGVKCAISYFIGFYSFLTPALQRWQNYLVRKYLRKIEMQEQ